MKKVFAILLTLILCLGMLAAPVAAADSTEVYMTIASAGTLVAAQEKVTVTDIDGDNALTINDALYCAHEALYEGGAAAGYASGETEYGLSLNKLWGVENGGSYGYWVNNVSAWSLADPVADGDYINAFSYADLTAWSDSYAYFNANTAEAGIGEGVTLTLYATSYDENWNRVASPCAGAAVTVGEEQYTTDANGKVTLSFDKAGSYTVTASSDSVTLVPPVCTVTVKAEAQVYVTIADAGKLVAAYEKVFVTDVDGDENITINDALYCAHEALYEGGAAAGYASGESEYGLSLNKLWGADHGSFGYWVNNASAWSLADGVKTGDHVYAFTYSDLEAWSDAYSWFNSVTAEIAVGETLDLALSSAGYDAEWNSVTLPCEGATVTADGAEFTTDANGAVSVAFDKAGTYVVTASSDSATLVPPVCVVTVRSFADTVGSWAAEEIEDVIAQGLFSGTNKGFEPKTAMSRAMLVTVLYRLDGKPAVNGENTFVDVKSGSYYENAVLWAAANGIVTGYEDGTFRPDQNVSREQLAAFLWRYAKYKNYDVSVGEDTNILSYTDALEVKEYAMSAMQWACGAGVITGKTVDTLDPNGSATREQVAVVLNRFADLVK